MNQESQSCPRRDECKVQIECTTGDCEEIVASAEHFEEATKAFLDLQATAAHRREFDGQDDAGILIDRPYFHITLRSG